MLTPGLDAPGVFRYTVRSGSGVDPRREEEEMAITGNAIRYAEIHRLVGGLTIEITTGMKVGRGHSVMLVANQWSGSAKRTKKGALEDLVVWFYRNGGTLDAQWSGVERALGADRKAKLHKAARSAEVAYIADLLKPVGSL